MDEEKTSMKLDKYELFHEEKQEIYFMTYRICFEIKKKSWIRKTNEKSAQKTQNLN